MLMQPNSPPAQLPPQSGGLGVAPQTEAPEGPAPDMEEDDDIVAGLEAHLNQIPDDQKQYLMDAIIKDPETLVNVLGIVNGAEVHDYFKNVATQLTQANSAPQPQNPQSPQQPQMPPQAQAPQMPPQQGVLPQ